MFLNVCLNDDSTCEAKDRHLSLNLLTLHDTRATGHPGGWIGT